MKYVKMLGLMVLAVAALVAFAATASATTLTSFTGTTYTSTIKAESEGATTWHGSFLDVNCGQSTMEGTIGQHGSGVTAKVSLSKLFFFECNFTVSVLKAGALEVHATNCNANGECTGTLTSSGAEVTIQTSMANCIFTTSNTDLAEITPTNDTGGTATFDVGSAGIPRTGHSVFCGAAALLTGSYKVTTPDSLWIDA